ncbi:hypothetical protein ACFX11_012258 [Malus domestica]
MDSSSRNRPPILVLNLLHIFTILSFSLAQSTAQAPSPASDSCNGDFLPYAYTTGARGQRPVPAALPVRVGAQQRTRRSQVVEGLWGLLTMSTWSLPPIPVWPTGVAFLGVWETAPSLLGIR